MRLEKPLLIIKTGSTIESLRPAHGDFEDWFLAGLGLDRPYVTIRTVDLDEKLPAPGEVSGALVTGSPAMMSHRFAWSERTACWLAGAVPTGLPILGVCYGHQLLAHALGGRVGPNPNGREIGTVSVRLIADAARDPLLGDLGLAITVQETHLESVLELPPGAVRLAESDLEPNQAFRVGAAAWGLQFHPEIDAEIMHAYVAHRRPVLEEEGLDVDSLLAAIEDSPTGAEILRRFTRLVDEPCL